MKRLLHSVFLILLLAGSNLSCTEDLDFTQFDDLEATPTYEAGILYLETTEELINLISGTNVFSQNFNFDAFSSDVFAERVLDGTITFVVENTTSKEIELIVEFLDEGNTVTDREVFLIQPAPSAIIRREIAYGDTGRSIDIIRTLTTIRVTATNLGDNTSVSNLPNPLITLQSSGRFRVRLK
ncbi:MAG: hypothetical protein ABJN95_17625 [Maribacter sp.]|uniref:hypothetical protein n=1 Tax=Maribacter sp. TaxID=1897614 RepID=UPI003299F749